MRAVIQVLLFFGAGYSDLVQCSHFDAQSRELLLVDLLTERTDTPAS